ncbi:hypothetical protein WDW86_14730 [Bdellovibrionota bacterium FG-2]
MMTFKVKLLLVMIVASGLAAGCGSDVRDRENYGDVQASSGGIRIVDAQEHKGGYGRKDCLVCHNVFQNIHRGPTSSIDADELNRVFAAKGYDTTYCMSCHGTNGTE